MEPFIPPSPYEIRDAVVAIGVTNPAAVQLIVEQALSSGSNITASNLVSIVEAAASVVLGAPDPANPASTWAFEENFSASRDLEEGRERYSSAESSQTGAFSNDFDWTNTDNAWDSWQSTYGHKTNVTLNGMEYKSKEVFNAVRDAHIGLGKLGLANDKHAGGMAVAAGLTLHKSQSIIGGKLEEISKEEFYNAIRDAKGLKNRDSKNKDPAGQDIGPSDTHLVVTLAASKMFRKTEDDNSGAEDRVALRQHLSETSAGINKILPDSKKAYKGEAIIENAVAKAGVQAPKILVP